jgi:hypothetical protein
MNSPPHPSFCSFFSLATVSAWPKQLSRAMKIPVLEHLATVPDCQGVQPEVLFVLNSGHGASGGRERGEHLHEIGDYALVRHEWFSYFPEATPGASCQHP